MTGSGRFLESVFLVCISKENTFFVFFVCNLFWKERQNKVKHYKYRQKM